MKRSLIALSLALAATAGFAGTDEYRFDAGERDTARIQVGDSGWQRFEAGQQDPYLPVG